MPPEDSYASLAVLLEGPIFSVAAFVLGAVLGSFANVCILRIPSGKSIVRPGSHCFGCGAPVRWFDNLPILSYLVLRGRCRACGARFSARYMLVEAAMGLLVVATWRLALAGLAPIEPVRLRLARFAAYVLLELVLLILTFTDLDHRLIPDRITKPSVPFFLVVGLLLRDLPWYGGLVGAVVGYGVVRLISDAYYALTGREGLGYGDGKLLAVVGALLGWRAVVFALFGGSVLGTVIGVTAIVLLRSRRARVGSAPDDETPLRYAELPFGPFLVAAALAYLFLQGSLTVALSSLTG